MEILSRNAPTNTHITRTHKHTRTHTLYAYVCISLHVCVRERVSEGAYMHTYTCICKERLCKGERVERKSRTERERVK